MAAWDLPLEGQLSSSSAEPQTLKQVYPERPMSKHERSLFVTAGETEKLPQLKDHGYRFLTAPEVLDGRSEAVKRSMSTFTASIPELRTFRKSELIRKFRTHTYDTGSARVQVAILTERVEALQRHLSGNNHDKSSKRMLQMLVHRRRKMLSFLMESDFAGYRILIREMGLRALPFMPVRFTSTRGQTETHKALRAKHSRQKRRAGRGAKGH
ncbi:hypothetical protein FNF27_05014 [Cafeteria roenbergensis]|nr:hypothetical protein FNF31_03526 [Cafeteria roenbergensis]KAA0168368.1 hypothetical protein FNF28_02528 [Cafeteria roenbergensis]KAA0173519.1 hypothetical protein FNF27_05014 [Cafeteria roenbergensis]